MARHVGTKVEIESTPPKVVTDYISDNELEVANQIKDNAKGSNAFKDITGSLRRSIKVEKNKDRSFVSSTEVYDLRVRAGNRSAPHAHLVEYGHGGPHAAPAKSFLRTAKDKAISQISPKLGK